MNAVFLEYDKKLNICGLRCPLPILHTKRVVKQLGIGQKLLIIATDPSFTLDCQVFVRQGGYKLLQSWQLDDKFYFVVEK